MLAALVDRSTTAIGIPHDPAGRSRITQLHAAFLHTRQPGRTLITTTAWPATRLTARDLPRIRDRLTRLYRDADDLPGPLGDPEWRRSIADSLDRARLYWIDPEFADLADHAAGQLPDTTIDPDLLPAADGLLVWANPVHNATIAAASWTTSPGGHHQLVCYRPVGGGADPTTLQHLREQVGWLAPIRATTTAGAHQPLPGRSHTAALVATWLLIAQKVTEAVPADLGRAIRKAYARQRRPVPDVQVVRIRSRPGSRTTARHGTTGGRQPLQAREWVGEHWKQQAYGPGRSRRKLIYIAPYLRGPDDQPIRATSTVRVLGSTRHRQPRKDQGQTE
jgi:hypothetical protein